MEYLSEKKRLHKFQELFLQATEICLAVSYVRDSGVKIIKPLYNKNQSIKILLDTKMNISEKHALKILLSDGVQLKSYNGVENYHPKVFLFLINNIWQAIIGSMNLTRGGLIENIEYGIFINDKSVQEPKKWFENLWNNAHAQIIDNDFIDAMPVYNYQRLPRAKVLTILKSERNEEEKEIESIKEFILCWATDTTKSGQSMRKNGWRFRPAHGPLDKNKLIVLKRILLEGTPIQLTDVYCNRVFSKFKSFSRESHSTSPKDLFVRIYKNYMDKLGIINYEKRNSKLTLTPLGENYIQSKDENLIYYVIKALTEYKWFNIPIKEYLFEILEYTDNWLHRNEILLFVKHAGVKDYSCYSSYDIAKLILAFRRLNESKKTDLIHYAQSSFNATDRSNSKSSWPNMAGNGVNDLLVDFCSFNELTLEDNYLKLRR